MDFNAINTAADAERGADLHLVHPQLRHPLYTGPGADVHGRWADRAKKAEPVILRVRGIDSPVARATLKRLNTKAAKHSDDENGLLTAISLVTGVQGVFDGKRQIEATEADLRWLFGRSEDFAVQVINFAGDRGNFFADAAATS